MNRRLQQTHGSKKFANLEGRNLTLYIAAYSGGAISQIFPVNHY
jgi:hypothetical protein